jgi:hypothetical protein
MHIMGIKLMRSSAWGSTRMSQVGSRTRSGGTIKPSKIFPAHYDSHVQLGRIFRKSRMVEKSAYHEEMARRSHLKIPLWELRKV